MIIVLKPHASEEQIEDVNNHIKELGYEPRIIRGVERTVIGAVGDELSHRSLETLIGLTSVETVMPIQKRYKVVSREFHPQDTRIDINGQKLGAGAFQVIAGPCGVESQEQIHKAAADLKKAGIKILRAGAYKPRTSPYAFQGLREKGLELLAEVKKEYGLAIATEIVGVPYVEKVAEVADILQIGARNCQNYHLLEVVAGCGKTVLLKRGMSTTVEEWLSAAEYLVVNGCENVILCERGIRTFETATRNTLDVGAIAVAKQESHLPVVVDPSHAAGKSSLVIPLALAGIAAGADGLLIEAHPNPVDALSDAAQQIKTSEFNIVMKDIKRFVDCAGKILQ